MHALDLEVGGDDLQVGVDAAHLVLLQLGADVLHDQVDGNQVVAPGGAPREGGEKTGLHDIRDGGQGCGAQTTAVRA